MARATALVLALGAPLISVLACARNPASAWSRQRRDFGKFEEDVSDAPVSESQTSYGGYKIVSRTFNTRLTTYPIVETIHCRVVQRDPVAATPR